MLSVITSFISSLLIALLSIPSVIVIARKLELYDVPGERKMHSQKTPLLGGLAIFASTLLGFIFWAAPYFERFHLFILAALLILFFIGLRDDILPVKPVIKIFGQLIAAFLVIAFCDLRITGLHGLFGIHTVSVFTGSIVTLFVILFIINAFNLIDGLDGLAASLGLLASLSFGILFFNYQDMFMAVLSFTLAGALLGFLFYNFHPAKIFMGDTGSMTVGFVLSLLAIRFVELNKSTGLEQVFDHRSAPVFVLAVLIIPVMDAIRVFMLRLLKRRSPFSADRLHIHHQLLRLGFGQKQTAVSILALNMTYILFAWLFRNSDSGSVFYIFIISSLAILELPHLILNKRKNRLIV